MEIQKIAQKERERIAREEEIEEKRKELSKKNVTVDIKGELVFIKPIDLNGLNEEFNKGKSNFKMIKTIEREINNKNKKSLMVEKNPEMNIWDFKDDKKKKKKKKDHLLATRASNNIQNSSSKKGEVKFFDKHEKIYVAGSNFSIINPEVGVNVIEDKKMKTGGKDFYKKFNRFSLEVFQDQLSKTTRTSFFPSITEPTNENTNTIKEKAKRRFSVNTKGKIIPEVDSKLLESNLPTEDNRTLSVKTKNLKAALQNLDLISEGEEKNLGSNKKTINKNIIKRAMNKFGPTNIDYKEMDVFAKTLMGSNNWGGEIYSNTKKKNLYKMPKKPEKYELQRELPANLLNHMPRKRLPPIINSFRSNNMGKTSMGFFTNRKPKKFKLMIDENNEINEINKNIKTERNEL